MLAHIENGARIASILAFAASLTLSNASRHVCCALMGDDSPKNKHKLDDQKHEEHAKKEDEKHENAERQHHHSHPVAEADAATESAKTETD